MTAGRRETLQIEPATKSGNEYPECACDTDQKRIRSGDAIWTEEKYGSQDEDSVRTSSVLK